MKLYISSDMEGSTGVVAPCQVDSLCPEYSFGRAMQLHDVLSAVEAAFEWGIEEVTINDSHNTMINLDVSAFPSSTQIIWSFFYKFIKFQRSIIQSTWKSKPILN